MTTTTKDLLMQEMCTNPDVTPCTHRETTREHLDTCCADGIDCDQCGRPTGVKGPDIEPGDQAILCDACTALIP